jgi:hypothetical protein
VGKEKGTKKDGGANLRLRFSPLPDPLKVAPSFSTEPLNGSVVNDTTSPHK